MLNEPLLESRRQGRKEKVHVAKNSLARSLARPDFQALLVASSPEFVNSRSNFVGAGTTLLRFDGTSPLPDGLAGPSVPPSPLILHAPWWSIAVPSLEESSRRRANWKWEYHRPLHPSLLLYPSFYFIQSPTVAPTIVVFRARNLDTPYSPSPTRTIMKDINYNFISNYRWNTFQITWA